MNRAPARIAALALLAASTAAAYMALVVPVLEIRRGLEARLEHANEMLERQTATLATLPALRAGVQQQQTTLAADPGWLTAPTPAQAMAAVQDIVKQAASGLPVTIGSIQALPTAAEDSNLRVAVRVAATLPADALPALLRRLEGHAAPWLWLENVELYSGDVNMGFATAQGISQPVALRADVVAFQRRPEP